MHPSHRRALYVQRQLAWLPQEKPFGHLNLRRSRGKKPLEAKLLPREKPLGHETLHLNLYSVGKTPWPCNAASAFRYTGRNTTTLMSSVVLAMALTPGQRMLANKIAIHKLMFTDLSVSVCVHYIRIYLCVYACVWRKCPNHTEKLARLQMAFASRICWPILVMPSSSHNDGSMAFL